MGGRQGACPTEGDVWIRKPGEWGGQEHCKSRKIQLHVGVWRTVEVCHEVRSVGLSCKIRTKIQRMSGQEIQGPMVRSAAKEVARKKEPQAWWVGQGGKRFRGLALKPSHTRPGIFEEHGHVSREPGWARQFELAGEGNEAWKGGLDVPD